MPKGPVSPSAQLQVTSPMFSRPSGVSPDFCPLLRLFPGPLPGIYYTCAIPSPPAQLALSSFPWAGEGPKLGLLY